MEPKNKHVKDAHGGLYEDMVESEADATFEDMAEKHSTSAPQGGREKHGGGGGNHIYSAKHARNKLQQRS